MKCDNADEGLLIYKSIVNSIKNSLKNREKHDKEILIFIDNSLKRFIDSIELSVGGSEYNNTLQNFKDHTSALNC